MAGHDHPKPVPHLEAEEAAIADERRRRGVMVGMGYLVLSGLIFATFTAIIRSLSSDLHPAETAFIRYLFGFLLVLPLFMGRRRDELKTKRPVLHISRGLIHGCGVLLWFYAISKIQLAEVTALAFTSPVWATIGAFLVLREQIHFRRIVAVFLGLLGAMIVLFNLPTSFEELSQNFSALGLGQVAILVSAPLFACSKIMTKRLTETENTTAIVAWLSLTVTFALAVPAMLVWRWPTMEEWFWLAIVAGLATTAHICMTRAWRAADISVTQPAEFLQLVWASLIGIYMFGETPTIGIWIGGAVIVGSATYIAHREAATRRQGRARAAVATGANTA
ncbi:DMT family transporter [Minwuia sp.]|uniref:DMT family transporter n=1 Tax=Minwuia sp. TaxID=2493630 RepID=UPI003A90B6A6